MKTETKAMKPKHTPVPWEVDPDCTERVQAVHPDVNDVDGIAECFGPNCLDNAVFIVRAVNVHDDLLAAAKELVRLMDEVDPNTALGDEADRVFPHYEFNDLRAAIAKAEGRL